MELLIFGCGGHGRVIADAARASGAGVVGWASEDASLRGRTIDGHEVVAIGVEAAARLAAQRGCGVVVGIGGNRVRQRVSDALVAAGATLASVVHPRAVLGADVELGAGSVVFAGAVVNVGGRIGAGVILNTACSVDHDARLGDYVHLSPGVHLGGTVTVGSGTHLGVGVAVRNNIVIGEWSIVGVGSAVVADVPGGVVAYGVPARVTRSNPDA
jgi:sugar O-acyltransferase (sialic acid O-acetyltransferase NeuD family)